MALRQKLLDLYTSDKEKFCRLFTGVEMWIHQWDPESKLKFMQWKHVEFLHPKKCRTQSSVSKVIATIIWDSEELFLIDYLPPKKTITGHYYAELTFKLLDTIKQKRHGKLSLGVWLFHNNAPVHKSLVVQQVVRDCGFIQLKHPTYSLDHAPSDYYLFRNRFVDDKSNCL